MNDVLDNFKSQWNEAKEDKISHSISAKDLIDLSRQKIRSAVIMHIKNIAVLVLTLIGILAFFIYVAPFRNTLSHLGMFLMTGTLSVRILIEIFSIYRSSKIDMSSSATSVNNQYISFYNYRKKIHGPVTIGILLGYSIGYYLLIPEFDNYLSKGAVILLAVSYLGVAAIFSYSIRRAIIGEMRVLRSLLQIHEQITINKEIK